MMSQSLRTSCPPKCRSNVQQGTRCSLTIQNLDCNNQHHMEGKCRGLLHRLYWTTDQQHTQQDIVLRQGSSGLKSKAHKKCWKLMRLQSNTSLPGMQCKFALSLPPPYSTKFLRDMASRCCSRIWSRSSLQDRPGTWRLRLQRRPWKMSPGRTRSKVGQKQQTKHLLGKQMAGMFPTLDRKNQRCRPDTWRLRLQRRL